MPLPGTEKTHSRAPAARTRRVLRLGPGQAAEAPGFEYRTAESQNHQKQACQSQSSGPRTPTGKSIREVTPCVSQSKLSMLCSSILQLARDVASHFLDLFLRDDETCTRFKANLPNFPANSVRIGSAFVRTRHAQAAQSAQVALPLSFLAGPPMSTVSSSDLSWFLT